MFSSHPLFRIFRVVLLFSYQVSLTSYQVFAVRSLVRQRDIYYHTAKSLSTTFFIFCFFWSVMFTFKESHTRQTVKSFSKMPFYRTMHDRMSAKKAKPALCFARIANAILGEVTLHNSSFLLIKKEFVTLSFQRHITNSLSLTYLSFPYLIKWMIPC